MTLSANDVDSKDKLVEFIENLRDDFVKNSFEWENPSIERFLDAMAAWVNSIDSYRKNNGLAPLDEPAWETVATMLLAGKSYE